MISLTVPLLAALSLVAAAPLQKKQYGVEVINNCYQSGQVALTFDGEPLMPLLSPLRPRLQSL